MKKELLKFALLVAVIANNSSYGIGVGVTKAILKVDATPGETIIDSSVCIVNPNSSYWRVSASISNASRQDEYEPVPDLSWISVETEEVVVPPKSRNVNLKFSISVPDSPYYYNRRFSAKADISFGSGGALVPGVIVPILISTPASSKIPEKCPGCKVEIYPNTLFLETNLWDTLVVFNWDTIGVHFRVGFGSKAKPRFVDWLELYVRTKSGWQINPETIYISPKGKLILKIKALAPFHIYNLYLINENITKAVKIIWGRKQQ